jgi:uncharacterized protein (TIGR02145 family)
MSRARVDIQKDVNTYRADLENRYLTLNSPTWANSKSDYRYLDMLEKYAEVKSKLSEFERELAEAKERGERGRTPSEIRNEISSSQSNMNFYRSTRDRAGRNSMQGMMSEEVAKSIQCTINALQQELSVAMEESTEQGEKRREEMERKHREKEAERKRREEEAERKRREEQERQAKEKAEAEKAILELIADFTKKIEFNPKDATAYNSRGIVYTQRGETNKAFEDFNQAILLNPDYADAYCNRGSMYVYKDNFDLAIADFDKAIQLNPNDEKAYFCRGSVYSDKKGNYSQAIADFEASLRINPNNSFARQFLNQTQKLKKEAEEREQQAKEQENCRIKEKRKRLLLIIFSIALGLGIATAIFIDSPNKNTPDENPEPITASEISIVKEILTDSRDNKTYETIKIGSQTWFAENLNYNAKGSKCYDNNQENCAKYGKHYNWNTALKACPKGWHLPSNAEWDELYRFADGTSGTDSPYESPAAGKHLKAKSGWNDFNGSSGNGLDTYSFAALPGGSNYSGKFHLAGINGYWWSASERDGINAYYRFMLNESGRAGWNNKTKSLLLNVRCVKD